MSSSTPLTRYHSLDALRAAAMLAGVYYHALLFGGMFGNGGRPGLVPPGQTLGLNGSMIVQDWLHSFRMPLFFLISGFFCRMMWLKYGTRGYLIRRWMRLGLPLLIGIFTFVPLYQLAQGSRGPGGGPPAMGGPPGMGGFGVPPGMGAGGLPFGMDIEALPPPPPGFVPPPLEPFDANADGDIDDAEWAAAKKALSARGGNRSTVDDPVDGLRDEPAAARGFGPPAGGPVFRPDIIRSPGGGPGGRFPRGGPFGDPGVVSSWLFGDSVRMFTLSHLWFLWYLILFATAAPVVARAVDVMCLPLHDRSVVAMQQVQRTAVSFIAPLMLGLIAMPLLLLTESIFGWGLSFAGGIGRGFPDFLWSVEWDMPFYAAYFFAGWWLHGTEKSLDLMSLRWTLYLALGLAAHAGAIYLSKTYSRQTEHAGFAAIRLCFYTLYALGGAFTAWGVIGGAQRFLNQPSRLGRYLSETAFWIYLLHQAILVPVLGWLGPFKMSWWLNAPIATLLTALACLVTYEAMVRGTSLAWLFGASTTRGEPSDGNSPPPTSVMAEPLSISLPLVSN